MLRRVKDERTLKENLLLASSTAFISGCVNAAYHIGFLFFGRHCRRLIFDEYSFTVFYFIPVILLTILYYDISPIALRKLSRLFSPGNKVEN